MNILQNLYIEISRLHNIKLFPKNANACKGKI